MPEGPSLVILRELVQPFTGLCVLSAQGNSKIDKTRLVGQKIVALRTWGKHLLIEFHGFSIRIHLLMFGSYSINERKDKPVRLSLCFTQGREMNFYACAVRYIEGELDDEYDWSGDVLSDSWDAVAASRKLRGMPNALVCDALLDQNVFAGVGNIIKNEVLFRIRLHPLSTVGALSTRKLNELVLQAREYSFEFLEWKKAFVLRQHWLVNGKGICPRCNIKLTRAYLGTTNRRTFYCERCQVRYGTSNAVANKTKINRSRSSKRAKVA